MLLKNILFRLSFGFLEIYLQSQNKSHSTAILMREKTSLSGLQNLPA